MRDRFAPKYATVEEILEVKTTKSRLPFVDDGMPGANLAKFAKTKEEPIEEGDDGFLYVRAKAISSRVNRNKDGWPSTELAGGYKTFMGRPVFVDHNNEDVRRTRGVIVDSRLNVTDDKTSALDPYYATAPDNHKPPTWIELLIEVDAKTYPELAKEIKTGRIDSVSMGANIERSVCSVCENEASAPSQYCDHIKQKGATFEITADNGEKIQKMAYEDCYGVNFFEISFVFDPADETAKIGKEAAAPGTAEPNDEEDRKRNHIPQSELKGSPPRVDTLRDELLCKNCQADHYREDADGIERCPTCGDEAEPRPLDNPDLTKSLRDEKNVVDESGVGNDNEENGITFDETPAKDDSFIQPIEPIKPAASVQVMNEMKFETKLETDDPKVIESAMPTKTARREITLTHPMGIGGGTIRRLSAEGLSGEITFETGTTLPLPIDRPGLLVAAQIKARRAGGHSTNGEIPVTLEFPEEEIERAIEIVTTGGMTAEAAKKVIKPGGKPADTPKDVKVISDQTAPVESKLTIKETDEMESKEADRRQIIRSENPDGSRSEKIVEETGELEFDETTEAEEKRPVEEPKAEEDTEAEETDEKDEKQKLPFAASVENPEQKLLAAFALADEAVDLGLVEKDEKLAYVARLEKETMEQIESRRDVHSLIKNAGLKKQTRVAGVRSLPRVTATSIESNPNGSVDLDSIADEAIFL
jgi:hypothetical protein